MKKEKKSCFHTYYCGLLFTIVPALLFSGAWATETEFLNLPGISKLADPWSDEKPDKTSLFFSQTVYSFDYGDPTAAEQAHLEAINRARLDPAAEAALLGINLFEGVPPGDISGLPVQPLVLNSKLIQAARLHSKDMIDQDYFAHNSLSGKTPFNRINDAGYQYSYAGENLALIGSPGPMDEVTTVLELHDNLFIDKNYPGRGHRVNILNENFKEVGLGVAFGDYQGYNTYMITCDFGTALQFSGSFILGVVYDDKDNDNFYDAGEGIGNVSIQLTNTGDATVTASQGGFGIPVFAGTYSVKATLSDGSTAQKQVTIGSENKKIDFLQSDFGSSSSSPTQVGGTPGNQVVKVSENQTVSLLVNMTNSAGAAPVYEWIWAKMIVKGNTSPVYVLTKKGWQPLNDASSLPSLSFDAGNADTYTIGSFSMAELGLSPGDSLTYGYAYTTGTVADLIVENAVTIQVK